MLGGWEAGKGKMVLRGNSFLMLKIVINGDIRLIHKYYPMPCNSGKHFMLKLLSVVEKRRPAPWGIPPPPPIGGIRASPPQHSPWERTRQQTAAPTFWPFTFDLDSRGEREGSWFFQIFLVSSSLWLPSTASAILRSSYHLLDNHHKVAEPLRRGAGKSKYRDADEPAKPREWELGGVYPQDERVISARLTRSGRNRTPPGLDMATRRAEHVCSHGCVRMHVCAHAPLCMHTWGSPGLVPAGPLGRLCLLTLAACHSGLGWQERVLLENKGRPTPGCAQTQLSELGWEGPEIWFLPEIFALSGKFYFIPCLDSFPTHPSTHLPQNCLKTLLITKLNCLSQNFV